MMRIDINDNQFDYKEEHSKWLLEAASNAYTSLLFLNKAFGLEDEKHKKYLADIEEVVKLAGGNMKDVRKNAKANMDYFMSHFLVKIYEAGLILDNNKRALENNTKVSA